ncbi:phosphatase PAP2 family protein [Acinetobacter tibetensis]|jgi:undecaprenyl-diphosphatase|uniref:phosphatase PAP2 family protein n=1 Tax=Acinetobacter TaxID=469 RepID=UPI000DE5EE48|nr:phosphatase PAP2 family protein [Acinetobacter sp. AM]PWB15099.1 phosphatidylglycerophosphatase [Acinetobacter sp. AM]
MNFKNAKIKILDLDLKGCLYLNHFSHSERVALFFKLISRLGDGFFWYIMLMSLWILQGLSYSLQMLYLILGSLLGTAIYKILKTKTVRPRPYQVHQVIRLCERPLDHFSFPSGHTLHAVMASVVIGYVQPILLVLMLPFTVLVALSRMVLGLHYPSDVAVGAVIGASVAAVIIACAPMFSMVL